MDVSCACTGFRGNGFVQRLLRLSKACPTTMQTNEVFILALLSSVLIGFAEVLLVPRHVAGAAVHHLLARILILVRLACL